MIKKTKRWLRFGGARGREGEGVGDDSKKNLKLNYICPFVFSMRKAPQPQ
jgi:hypothetical protein